MWFIIGIFFYRLIGIQTRKVPLGVRFLVDLHYIYPFCSFYTRDFFVIPKGSGSMGTPLAEIKAGIAFMESAEKGAKKALVAMTSYLEQTKSYCCGLQFHTDTLVQCFEIINVGVEDAKRLDNAHIDLRTRTLDRVSKLFQELILTPLERWVVLVKARRKDMKAFGDIEKKKNHYEKKIIGIKDKVQKGKAKVEYLQRNEQKLESTKKLYQAAEQKVLGQVRKFKLDHSKTMRAIVARLIQFETQMFKEFVTATSKLDGTVTRLLDHTELLKSFQGIADGVDLQHKEGSNGPTSPPSPQSPPADAPDKAPTPAFPRESAPPATRPARPPNKPNPRSQLFQESPPPAKQEGGFESAPSDDWAAPQDNNGTDLDWGTTSNSAEFWGSEPAANKSGGNEWGTETSQGGEGFDPWGNSNSGFGSPDEQPPPKPSRGSSTTPSEQPISNDWFGVNEEADTANDSWPAPASTTFETKPVASDDAFFGGGNTFQQSAGPSNPEGMFGNSTNDASPFQSAPPASQGNAGPFGQNTGGSNPNDMLGSSMNHNATPFDNKPPSNNPNARHRNNTGNPFLDF